MKQAQGSVWCIHLRNLGVSLARFMNKGGPPQREFNFVYINYRLH